MGQTKLVVEQLWSRKICILKHQGWHSFSSWSTLGVNSDVILRKNLSQLYHVLQFKQSRFVLQVLESTEQNFTAKYLKFHTETFYFFRNKFWAKMKRHDSGSLMLHATLHHTSQHVRCNSTMVRICGCAHRIVRTDKWTARLNQGIERRLATPGKGIAKVVERAFTFH